VRPYPHYAPQAGKAVQNLVTLAIPDIDAIGMGDHPWAASGMEGLVVGKGVKMVVDIVLDDFSDVYVFQVCGHGSSPSCDSAKMRFGESARV
jgi:hypothetical protein